YNLDKLSTNFETWIEKDLLKMNALDVERIRLRDYSILRTNRGLAADMRLEAAVHFNSTESKWELEELANFNGKNKQATKLLEDEELNKEKLDGMKTALDDLKIVDVRRKPKGLSSDLRAEDTLANDNEGVKSLTEKGFYLVGKDLYSANGEVFVGMKD